jgi:hypothetical protein
MAGWLGAAVGWFDTEQPAETSTHAQATAAIKTFRVFNSTPSPNFGLN